VIILNNADSSIRRCVSAQELWKLKVVVFQEDIEPVLIFLGKMGTVQSIDVNDEPELTDGLLEKFKVPCEITDKIYDIFIRIDRKLEELQLKIEDVTEKKAL